MQLDFRHARRVRAASGFFSYSHFPSSLCLAEHTEPDTVGHLSASRFDFYAYTAIRSRSSDKAEIKVASIVGINSRGRFMANARPGCCVIYEDCGTRSEREH